MEFQQLIRRRRMVRRFEQRPIPSEVLHAVLESARHAPSAGFTQGTELVVLDSPQSTRHFWSTTTDPKWPRSREQEGAGPPVIVLPLSNKKTYLDRYSRPDKAGAGLEAEEAWPVPYWDLDAAMAVMVMLLAATDSRLGGWFFGIFHGEERLLRDLGVPAGYRPIGAVGLGYPAPDDRAVGSVVSLRRRPLEDMVHRNAW